MSNPIRRIVTGNDSHGKSVFVIDGPATNVKQSPARPGVVINNLWMTDAMPAKTKGDDAGAKLVKLEPVEHGTNFRIVEFPPEKDYIGKVSEADARKAFSEMGGAHAIVGGDKPKHPFMHRTRTLDYAIVLEGEVFLQLDDTETLMKAGDVCIQRAANHVWSNRSDRNCKIAFILIDGDGEAGGH
jgi:mannose-6-phosphate isomerase-like protein (cupin superfamily)